MHATTKLVRTSLFLAMLCMFLNFATLIGGLLLITLFLIIVLRICGYKYAIGLSILASIYASFVGLYPNIIKLYSIFIVLSNISFILTVNLVENYVVKYKYYLNIDSLEIYTLKMLIGLVAMILTFNISFRFSYDIFINILLLELGLHLFLQSIIASFAGYKILKLIDKKIHPLI